jgi:hypothetical protein
MIFMKISLKSYDNFSVLAFSLIILMSPGKFAESLTAKTALDSRPDNLKSLKEINQPVLQGIYNFKSGTQEQTWEYIVLHHSATSGGTAKSFDYYHRHTFNDPEGLEYHFVIDNGIGKASKDGQIEIGHRWEKQIEANHLFRPEKYGKSIAICFVGNFEKSKDLTSNQFEAAVLLIKSLAKRYSIPAGKIITHGTVDAPPKEDGRPTSLCPGKNFPYKRILESLAD